ncbi:MAG: hypothetical protein K5695_07515 [Oscillospiraceae bacterium]|nr:hypothetical protein [Oscillospiraceae bacterium]
MRRRMTGIVPAAMCLLLAGCSPNYATREQVIEFVKNNISEETELVSQTEEHAYAFRSTERDLTFTAVTSAETVNIDGTVMGYTGDHLIYTDYDPKCYAFHQPEVDALLEKHGFGVLSRSDNTERGEFDKWFTIVLDNSTADWDVRYADAFLNELRETVIQPEAAYHNGQALEYYFEVLYKIDDQTYQRTAGENYQNQVYPDTEIRLHEYLRPTDMFVDKALANPYNGVVIALKSEEE